MNVSPAYFQRKKKKKNKTKRNSKLFDFRAICCINSATWNLSDNPAFKKMSFSLAAKQWLLFVFSVLSWQKQEYKLLHIRVIIGSQSAIPEENNKSIWSLFSVMNIFYSPPFKKKNFIRFVSKVLVWNNIWIMACFVFSA